MASGRFRLFYSTKDWNPTSSEWQELVECLPPVDQRKIQSFRFKKDQKLACISRVLQRYVVSLVFGIPFASVVIQRTEENKPYYEPTLAGASEYLNWNFNVSHHGNLVVIAAEPNCLVGVDVMDLLERPRGNVTVEQFFSAFTNHFTASEWDFIKDTESDDENVLYRNMYTLWALKESFIKAVGIGLGYELRRLSFHFPTPTEPVLCLDGRERTDWAFQVEILQDQYIIAVAYGPPQEAYGTIFPHRLRVEETKLKADFQVAKQQKWEQVKDTELVDRITNHEIRAMHSDDT